VYSLLQARFDVRNANCQNDKVQLFNPTKFAVLDELRQAKASKEQ